MLPKSWLRSAACVSVAMCAAAVIGSRTAGAAEQESVHRSVDETEARSTWVRLVTLRVESPARQELAQKAVDRFFATEGGRWLIGELGRIRIDPVQRQIGLKIDVRFVESLPPEADEDIGYYSPREAGAEAYEVLVRFAAEARPDTGDGTRTIELFGIYPDNSACDIIFWYQEPESTMAHTLFHELLHIWFIHTYRFEQRKYPTGHNNARWCQFEEEFLELLRAHARDLEQVEGVTPPGNLRATPTPGEPDHQSSVAEGSDV
jgi:hypothetical protein